MVHEYFDSFHSHKTSIGRYLDGISNPTLIIITQYLNMYLCMFLHNASSFHIFISLIQSKLHNHQHQLRHHHQHQHTSKQNTNKDTQNTQQIVERYKKHICDTIDSKGLPSIPLHSIPYQTQHIVHVRLIDCK